MNIKKLIFATNNKHKIYEVKLLLPDVEIITPNDLHDETEVEENSPTLEGNSFLKAKYFFDKYHLPVIADDTGLFCLALDDKPGVYSARYASLGMDHYFHDDMKNRKKLINDLKDLNHDAYFECVICLIENQGKVSYFHGRTYGHILESEDGSNGFGYDSIFYSNDLNKTFGQATDTEKGSVSHRGRAIIELKKYLNQGDE